MCISVPTLVNDAAVSELLACLQVHFLWSVGNKQGGTKTIFLWALICFPCALFCLPLPKSALTPLNRRWFLTLKRDTRKLHVLVWNRVKVSEMIKFTISQFAKCSVKKLAVSKSSLSTKFDRVHLGLKKYSQYVLRLSAVIFLFYFL